MRIIGFAGWSGSGKTTLLARLIPALVANGKSVSSIKHAHHAFDIDQPGKDSHTHRSAGHRHARPLFAGVVTGQQTQRQITCAEADDLRPHAPTGRGEKIRIQSRRQGPQNARRGKQFEFAKTKASAHAADEKR